MASSTQRLRWSRATSWRCGPLPFAAAHSICAHHLASQRGAHMRALTAAVACMRKGGGAQQPAAGVAGGVGGHQHPLARLEHGRRGVVRRRGLPGHVPHHARHQLHLQVPGAALLSPLAPCAGSCGTPRSPEAHPSDPDKFGGNRHRCHHSGKAGATGLGVRLSYW